MFEEEDLLPISGLQHLVFCERQWGLIHIEQQWEENRLTAQGRVMHERAHELGGESRPGVRIARGLRLRSLALGLVGQADIVEFHQADRGGALEGFTGLWQAYPVEYKRGRPKPTDSDEVQLCAQALCLEEMFGVAVSAGALYYGSRRRRTEVDFGESLRTRTATLARHMHELYSSGQTPPAVYQNKCDNCSLVATCMPRLLSKPPTVASYLSRALASGDE